MSPVPPTMARQAAVVAGELLRREVRSGEVAWVTIPFGAVALLLIPLAVGTDIPLLERLGPGMYWVVVLLFGVLVAVRSTGADTPAQRDVLALLGLDPAAGFAGRAAAASILLLGFQLVTGVVAVALYDVPLRHWPWLLSVMPLMAAGLGMLGTIAGGVAAGAGSSALVPLLVAPLAVPLLLAATQTHEGLRLGHGILGWLLLMVTVDLVLAISGVLSARPLQETR